MTTLNITFDEQLVPFSRFNKEEIQQDFKEIFVLFVVNSLLRR